MDQLDDDAPAVQRAAPPELADMRAELDHTRAQLIARDKLASLGELSAGVAHELRNPLHFITNYSASAIDIVAELRELLADAAAAPPLADPLAHLARALEGIADHGSRANRIVTTVLAQAKQASGLRVHANFNETLHDSLRLAYHGQRARSAGVEIQLNEDYDERVGAFEFVRDELSRVFINLFENAYHAVQLRALGDCGPDYSPQICATTRDLGERVEVRISDNGPGIPAPVAARVFEPFFTTKPADEGTGLGLSISHELVTRGSQGTLDLDTEEGRGCIFIITIPKRPLAQPSAARDQE